MDLARYHSRLTHTSRTEGAVRIDAADLLSCNAIEEVVNEIRLMSAPEG